MNSSIETYLNNPDYTVRHIKVEGFASPEGPYDNNMRLAKGRAESIIDYIISKSGLDRSRFTVGRTTENWVGLRDTLQTNPTLPGRDKLLSLIAHTSDTEVLKTRLTKEAEYKYLLEHIYPHLRLSTYTVDYDVKTYESLEAKTLLRSNPSALSPEEIYSVALTQGIGTEEADEAIEVLERLYPTSDLALTYKGITHIQHKRYAQAIQTLEQVKDKDSTVLNALGVAYAYEGQLIKAQNLFRQAAPRSNDARKNLNIIIRRTSTK